MRIFRLIWGWEVMSFERVMDDAGGWVLMQLPFTGRWAGGAAILHNVHYILRALTLCVARLLKVPRNIMPIM